MVQKKILLVDDSRVIRRMVALLFADKPYILLTAVNGREGVQMALAHCPDLILMDVLMPEMSGFEACVALRRASATRDIPIVMLTTCTEQQSLDAGGVDGRNHYIMKCAGGGEILEKVQDLLGV